MFSSHGGHLINAMYHNGETNLDLANMNEYITFGEFCQLVLKILSRNENQISIKGHSPVTKLRKMTGNNSNLDLVNINAHTKFSKVLSICSQGSKNLTSIKGHFHVTLNMKKHVYQSLSRSCPHQCTYKIW